MSCITKSARRNSERFIANQVLQNQDWLRVIQSSSLCPTFFEDKKIENSITLKGNSSYRIKSILLPGQDKQVQFEFQDNKVHDLPQFLRYQ